MMGMVEIIKMFTNYCEKKDIYYHEIFIYKSNILTIFLFLNKKIFI